MDNLFLMKISHNFYVCPDILEMLQFYIYLVNNRLYNLIKEI